jgi:two-component system LytT family response regulator
MMRRILIVDDEPLARRRLELILAELDMPGIWTGQADGVGSARAAIAEMPVDILLLDVRMRDGTGFDLLEALPPAAAPAVIFVTAFDDFAVRAFDIAAADYLVKPVSADRLRRAIERAEESLATRSPAARRAMLERIAADAPASPKERPADGRESEFWIRRAGGDFIRLDVSSIDYATVEEDYVRIFAAGRSYLLRESIRGLLGRLDPGEFLQVHRSAIVRASELIQVARGRFGQAEVVLRGGQRLPLGRVHGKAVQRLIRGHGEQARAG